MMTKPLGQMTIDEIAALTPEEFKRLADEHNDRSELQENARNRVIDEFTREAKERNPLNPTYEEFCEAEAHADDVDFSPLLDADEEVERPCTCGINDYDIEPPYDAFTKGCRDEAGEILGSLLQPRPSAPPPFDPKHAREDLTPTRRGILGVAKEVGRAVVGVLLSTDPEIQRASPDEFAKTQTLTETAERKSRHGRRLQRDDRRW